MSDNRRITLVLFGLSAAALLCIVLFMTLGAQGSWSFVLPFRGRKLLGLVVVGHAIAWSTVLFQTLTANRILTPAIMGFDALYLLCQTVLTLLFGAGIFARLDPNLAFLGNSALMTALALGLYAALFGPNGGGLHRILLMGVVLGVFMRSLAGFVQRLLDPNAFAILSDQLFARFSAIEPNLLALASGLIVLVSGAVWRRIRRLDVLALGRAQAVSLGLDWRDELRVTMGAVALLVAVSTALVGPVLFLGLLAAALAHLALGTSRHAALLPAASLIAVILLVGGQTVLERVFGFDTALSIVVEFIGGITFLALLLRSARQ